MNALGRFANIFDGIEPFAGEVPRGYSADFLGTLIDVTFKEMMGADPAAWPGGFVRTAIPNLERDGEGWFEAVDWIVAAREASDRYVMMTLGACFGAQAVGACRTLRLLNPMPYTLVAVEPVPENVRWIDKHMRDNAIDPELQWIVPLALSNSREPVFFPVGAAGSGAQNCYATNEFEARKNYLNTLLTDDPAEALRSLVLYNKTGLTKKLVEGWDFEAEIQLVSSITLADILGPFALVDYVEADMQQSEILVFPPAIDLLCRKVRRVHIGTHGLEVHQELHELFEKRGWEMVFSFEPNSRFETELGAFSINDGVLTVRNPDL